MLRRSLTVVVPLSLLILFGSGLPSFDEAKATSQESEILDFTIKSCSDFFAAESHLQAAYHTVTKGYKTIPGQKEPVGELEGIETPEKMQEFMTWYANGGMIEMDSAGEMCRAEMLMKFGEAKSLRAGFFIAEGTARNAEFFADKLLKQCTGKSLYKR